MGLELDLFSLTPLPLLEHFGRKVKKLSKPVFWPHKEETASGEVSASGGSGEELGLAEEWGVVLKGLSRKSFPGVS